MFLEILNLQGLVNSFFYNLNTFAYPLLLTSILFGLVIIASFDRTVKSKLVLERNPQALRSVRFYLLLLFSADITFIIFWYIDTFIFSLKNILYPFILINLVVALTYGFKMGLLTGVVFTLTASYYLIEPRYNPIYLWNHPENTINIFIGFISALIVGLGLRIYHRVLGMRVQDIRDQYWQVRRSLAEKVTEEGIMNAINKSSLAVSSALSLNIVLKIIAEESRNLVEADRAYIVLKEKNNNINVISTRNNILKLKKENLVLEKSFIQNILFKRKTPAILNLKENPTIKIFEERPLDIDQILIVPIITNQKIVGGMLTATDRHQRKFSDFDVKRLKLFTAHASIAISNAKQHEEIRELVRMRDRFISMASHELKSPLSAIKLYAQLLLQRAGGLEKQDVKQLSTINQEVDKVTVLINGLLDFSRLQSGKLELNKKPFSVVKLVSDRLGVLQDLNPYRKFIFDPHISKAVVFADRLRIDQVLTNIIANAIKYSDPETEIRIELKDEEGYFVISVIDKGPGIEKEKVTQIFEPFYQTAENKKLYGVDTGLGLGLYISQELVARHNGSIQVTSEVGKGSTFAIFLPKRLQEEKSEEVEQFIFG